MSTANFRTMRDFPLYANDLTQDGFRCPVCGAILDEEVPVCPVCGEDVEMEAGSYFDPFMADDIMAWVKGELEAFNDDLMFHRVELQGGYYYGVQFYVEVEHDLTAEDYTNDDCHYYFDCYRSAAYRKYAAEIRRICRKLSQLGKEYGFQEYVCTARFSNGEAIFELASNPRARLKAAVAS